MRRREKGGGAGDPFLLNDVRYGRLRHKRYREKHNHEHRLRQESDHARPACSHRSIRVAGIDCGESREESGQREEETSREHIPHESKRQWIIGEYRDQARNEQGDHKNQIGSEAENPRCLRRDDLVFVEQLPEIPVWLQDAGSALALDILFEPAEHTSVQRGEADHEQKLNDVVHDSMCHQSASPDNAVTIFADISGLEGIATWLSDPQKAPWRLNDAPNRDLTYRRI